MKKKLLYLALSIFSFSSLYAQTQPAAQPLPVAVKGAVIAIDQVVHDFGVIPYNSDGKHIFIITNTGAEPLIIYNCIKGCGCTQVDWTKAPIKPGEKGFVVATYNTRKVGEFNRVVDIYSSDVINPKVNIRLKGSVIVVPGGEATPVITETKVKPSTPKTTSPAESNAKW